MSDSEDDAPATAGGFADLIDDSDSDSDAPSQAKPSKGKKAPAPAPVATAATNKGSKKGAKKGGKNAGAQADDDDWDAILSSAADNGAPKSADPTAATTGSAAAAPMTDAAAAAAAFLAQSGLDVETAGANKKKKDKKKKKKGEGGGGEDGAAAAPAAAPAPPKQTAKGKAIADRLAKQREEEERVRKAQEEEERKRQEQEAKEAAERQRIADEKAEKKRRADEKKAKKKAEGTYKTKKQKEQEARAKAALDAMVAAGLEVPSAGAAPAAGGGSSKARSGTGKRKQGAKHGAEAQPLPPSRESSATTALGAGEDAEQDDEEEEEAAADEAAVAADTADKKEEPAATGAAADDWEDAADDWDTADVSEIVASLKVDDDEGGMRNYGDEEDLMEQEKREEQVRLRQQGLRQKKLEAERRVEEEKRRQEEEEQQRVIEEAEMRKDAAKKARLEREKAARAGRSAENLRSPIVCIMGHVDTGKTKLLDKIRQTSVQEGEAGGITQQIGATFFPKVTLCEKVAVLNATEKVNVRLPGMLVIDTPGHESFTNLRSRGSSLCDIAILVIDLMHGLEPQTIESLNLLRSKKTPFVVALNKIDRCYGWKATNDNAVRLSLAEQDESTRNEFHDRADRIRTELMEKGLNAELYWKNNSPANTVSLVPTSAISGEGIPDLLLWLVRLTQERLTEQIMFMPDLLECTVLEVKAIEGLGTTIDTIIVNGKLRENDKIVVCTLDGAVVTHIRALLTPPPSRELRIKSEYIHHKEIYGAMGVKLCAQNIDKAIAGTPIMVIGKDDDEDDIKEEVMRDFTNVMKMDLDTKGVIVQASTLGALEALMQFLRKECDPPIPVSSVNIGPIYRRDVMRASIMLEKGKPEYATILAFDVRIDADARAYAEETGVRIFTADIIYHLFDQFTNYMTALMEQRRTDAQTTAVFPCICKIMPQHVFNKKDPIIVGMEVIEGTLRVGTPLCIPALEGLPIGRVASIEDNHKQVQKLAKGGTGAVRIEDANGGSTLVYGRQFDAASGSLYSTISRPSIDALKANFKSELTKDDLKLLVQLKKVFGIP